MLAFVGVGLVVYEPALDGEFISDDFNYLVQNPYVTTFTTDSLVAILDPTSVLTLMVENYAPVHMLLHALEWQAFGTEVYGYHAVNVVLHALASFLLVVLLGRSGLSREAAVAGGAIFLVHAANVEAVAWISQLKSPASLVLALGALLAQPRRPALGTLLFALALLAKPSALFALPVLAIWIWTRAGADASDPSSDRHPWLWVGLWCAVLAAFAAVELAAFWKTAGYAPPVSDDWSVRLRSGAAIGMRYLAMAGASHGLSTFQEPEEVTSWINPWWLGSVVAFALLGARIAKVLRQRRVEAVWWAWAVAAWAPVSGVLALIHPMADRYLYSILPGLIGAALFALRDARDSLAAVWAARGRDPDRVRALSRPLGLAIAVAFALALAARSHDRAAIWQRGERVMVDAALHYPNGIAARTRNAARAAQLGDAQGAVEQLRAAFDRGYRRLDQLLQDPSYQRVRSHPGFRSLIEDMATDTIERVGKGRQDSQIEMRVLAVAHQALGDTAAAIGALERALAIGGPVDARVRADLARLRALKRRTR